MLYTDIKIIIIIIKAGGQYENKWPVVDKFDRV